MHIDVVKIANFRIMIGSHDLSLALALALHVGVVFVGSLAQSIERGLLLPFSIFVVFALECCFRVY